MKKSNAEKYIRPFEPDCVSGAEPRNPPTGDVRKHISLRDCLLEFWYLHNRFFQKRGKTQKKETLAKVEIENELHVCIQTIEN